MASTAKSFFQTLKSYIKAPWSYTGPVASPEYKHSLQKATDYRPYCPASIRERAIVPSSDPETVYDIKYYVRDQRRNHPPKKVTVMRKADFEKMRAEFKFDVKDFPKPYLNEVVDVDYAHREGEGGYEKGRPPSEVPHKGRTRYITAGGL